MFTGIIESTGRIKSINWEGDNIHFEVESELTKDTYIDQSISHNGVCLTVVKIIPETQSYVVTAIKETLDVTNLKNWKVDTIVNLERAMLPNTRLDGHFVQGHVDSITKCTAVQEVDGSWYFTFQLDKTNKTLIVHKGSIAINGTSLTVIQPEEDQNFFKVAIIPYTFEHTSFKNLNPGDLVNIEFDILGKYISKHIKNYMK